MFATAILPLFLACASKPENTGTKAEDLSSSDRAYLVERGGQFLEALTRGELSLEPQHTGRGKQSHLAGFYTEGIMTDAGSMRQAHVEYDVDTSSLYVDLNDSSIMIEDFRREDSINSQWINELREVKFDVCVEDCSAENEIPVLQQLYTRALVEKEKVPGTIDFTAPVAFGGFR